MAWPLISSEQLPGGIAEPSAALVASQEDEDSVDSLVMLDSRLALEELVEKDYNPAESSSGLSAVIERMVWASTPETRFSYRK